MHVQPILPRNFDEHQVGDLGQKQMELVTKSLSGMTPHLDERQRNVRLGYLQVSQLSTALAQCFLRLPPPYPPLSPHPRQATPAAAVACPP